MLSVLLGAATIAMNRGEQETLFRQAHDIRLQQEAKAFQHQYPYQTNHGGGGLGCHSRQKHGKQRHRGYSHGNIHQIASNLHSQAGLARSFGEDQRPATTSACDDLVLSVLKSPLQPPIPPSPFIPLQPLNIPPTPSSTHSSAPSHYQALQGSEDELVDDLDNAKETTRLDGFEHDTSHSNGSGGFQFLRRFRHGRSPKFEAHHRRVPTPIRRKSRGGRTQADILDGVTGHGNH